MTGAWTVFRKELVDALRDRRTLMTVLLSAVAMGPLVLMLISTLVARVEKQAEAREVVVQGIAQAPTLRNYLERQTYTVREAPADYEQQLAQSRLGDPVVVVPKDFEADLRRGEVPTVEVVSSSSNQRADSGQQRILNLLQGFNREQAALRLLVRGVSPALLQAVDVQPRDLGSPAARAMRLTGMLPFFVLMAVLYGALNAALDTTAGERERGSLEPLLTTPATRAGLVVGKWGAVAAVAMLIALLSSLSFLSGQWLLRSETLAANFQYGWPEALSFMAVLLPLAASLSALLMAIAIRCKTFKEAQAGASVLLLGVSLLPMMSMIDQGGERPWHLWVPALAQSTLMNRVLRGDVLGWGDWLITAVIGAALTAACLAYVARQLAKVVAR
ncbi:ABC transporter permease [Ideonella dechloratans]|uniref:ABC transporter permease n=1 Tax=Ideonella dechloratans TaxID=36863 RepID=A0A643FFH3_IDEDE|nr:ABC transporter permease [Ideonella dechloratans]KAB0584538.1 ABC transporter permease [Ideonella dechloratans]UFU10246.1 ABC transporter permease [Ideonella dechloratans]